MRLFLKLTVGTFATGWFFLLWCKQMILASDIPVTISFDEMQEFLQIFSISTILALVYIRFVDDTKLHYFLVIPHPIMEYEHNSGFGVQLPSLRYIDKLCKSYWMSAHLSILNIETAS